MPVPEPTATEEPTAAPEPTEAPEPPKAPGWDDLDHEQKKAFMKEKVLPKMKEVFSEFDAKRFADVKCTTCHGPGVKDDKFDMPNPKLPKLDPKDHFAKHKKKAKMLTFMMEKVAPAMRELLGEEEFNPETMKGFGCGNCHTMKMPPAPKPAKGE